MLGKLPQSVSGSYIFVVSPKGHLLYHPDTKRIGEDVSQNEIIQRVMRGENGEKRVVNTQQVDMLAGYYPVREAGWGIISQTPAESIIQASRQVIKKLFYLYCHF